MLFFLCKLYQASGIVQRIVWHAPHHTHSHQNETSNLDRMFVPLEITQIDTRKSFDQAISD